MNADPRYNSRDANSRLESVSPAQPSETNFPKKRRRGSSALEEIVARLFWISSSALVVLLIWKVGPIVVENYQYSVVKGKIRAEYENAVEQLQNDPLRGVSNAFELIAQKVRPSVVSVKAERRRGDSAGQGSGVIMSDQGYILTNEHVVRDAQTIEVTLHDRRVYRASIVGQADNYNDLAVLKVDAIDLQPAEWGNSDDLEVGSIVWAFGSPFGLDQTVTSGIVSAKNRFDERAPKVELLQTDAAVNRGNSGGPLVDAQGKVVGINTSIFGSDFLGISFAIPSVQARFVYDQTITKGYVSRGFLGAVPSAVYQYHASNLGLPDIDGARLSSITKDSPAARSGLKLNDVVRSWNGEPIRDYHMLYRLVSMTSPGDIADVEIVRDGQPLLMQVRVGERSKIDRWRPIMSSH